MNQTLKSSNSTLNYFWIIVYLLIIHFTFITKEMGGITIVSFWLLPILTLPTILITLTTHPIALFLLRFAYFICLGWGIAFFAGIITWYFRVGSMDGVGNLIECSFIGIVISFITWLWYLFRFPKNIQLEKCLAWGLLLFHFSIYLLVQFEMLERRTSIPDLLESIF